MKFAVKAIVVFALFAAVLTHAQSLPKFQHVIIVVQENRTPDNLFGGDTALKTAGADLQVAQDAVQWCLGACFDPSHGNSAWKTQNTNHAPSCSNDHSEVCSSTKCNGLSVGTQIQLPGCTPDSYVSPTYDGSAVTPYYDIASKYGFANYFYQTNQGPSQPAHDFLFGGTSAPTPLAPSNDFAAGNPSNPINPTGCNYAPNQVVSIIDPTATVLGTGEPPCFDHATLSDLLEGAGLTWKYYTNDFYDIWTAPNGIQHICLPQNVNPPAQCTNSDFTNHVVNRPSLILTTISPVTSNGHRQTNCGLANVSWVIPNEPWSDHPGLGHGQSSTDTEFGPNWVASIINTLGNSACLDTVNGQQVSYWQDTVIFVVWDDWGGFYDHIGAAYEVNWPNCTLAWGCGYTYGFRVPFLVVSAYTQRYISGACGGQGCTNNLWPYQHDFGSILAFIENNFNLGMGSLGFADAYAPEFTHTPSAVPLADFFNLTSPQPFVSVATSPTSFTGDYFVNYSGPPGTPDFDAIHPQD